jgi:hypothetical protein
MIYGYNSKLSTYGNDTILDYSRGFMDEIRRVRRTKEVRAPLRQFPHLFHKANIDLYTQLRERPLIFITHSFGGIILAHVS